MAINFPTSLDTNTEIKSTHANGDVIQSADDNNQSLAIKAIEAKLGIDSSAVVTSIDYKMAHFLHSALTSIGTDDHHDKLHAIDHGPGGIDELIAAATGVQGEGPDYYIFKSGSNYLALRTADNTVLFSSTNAATTVNQASDVLTGIGGGIIGFEGKTVFNCTSQIFAKDGVTLSGGRLQGEGFSNPPVLKATSSFANPLVRLGQTGYAGVTGFTIDAQSNATHAVLMDAPACGVNDLLTRGGTTCSVANTLAMPRQRVHAVRSDGNGACSDSVMRFNSTDHVVTNFTATGAGGAYGLRVGGNTGMFVAGHVTGNSSSKDALFVEGDQNQVMGVVCDTVGSGSTAVALITGSRNILEGVSTMNIHASVSRPAYALKQPGAGSNVYGNKISGTYISAAQAGSASGALKFLTNTGGTPSNLARFAGTRFECTGGDLSPISGSNFTNMPIATTDMMDIWIFASSPGSPTLQVVRAV
jgi:hypothetical protein